MQILSGYGTRTMAPGCRRPLWFDGMEAVHLREAEPSLSASHLPKELFQYPHGVTSTDFVTAVRQSGDSENSSRFLRIAIILIRLSFAICIISFLHESFRNFLLSRSFLSFTSSVNVQHFFSNKFFSLDRTLHIKDIYVFYF